ncbi:hypothetical protein OAG99_01530 [Akkermansiaceae bacterium]|nr:hypothetical protein [Akkermansiaceae bacterium]
MSRPSNNTSILSFKERLRVALDWLLLSQKVTKSGGSAAYWSPLLGWGPPYPETSGYIIPTLLRGYDYFGDDRYLDAANRMTDWLLSLQHNDGWFPGGTLRPKSERKPSIFNTGQILFGLAESFARTKDERVGVSAERGLKWLCDQQELDGRWLKHAYVEGYSPSYYAHVCWPMAVAARALGDESSLKFVRLGLESVNRDRNVNNTYSRWAFAPGKSAFTHTIAYTLQGVVESAIILDDWEGLATPVVNSAETLLRKFEIRRHLAGAYNQGWSGNHWYICLTGHCQMASTWMRIYERNGDARFLDAAVKLMETVCKKQKLDGRAARCGAIGGSAPLWGDYMRMRYPNWATKFFVDAMMELESNLTALNDGPRVDA